MIWYLLIFWSLTTAAAFGSEIASVMEMYGQRDEKGWSVFAFMVLILLIILISPWLLMANIGNHIK